MIDLSQRHTTEELLDQPNISQKDLWQNLHELETINRLLGGHSATALGLKKLLQKHPKNKTLRIADFGCGGGDTLRFVYNWCKRRKQEVELVGYDLLPEAIAYCEKHQPFNAPIQYKQTDLHKLDDGAPFDIVISSLFTHHLFGNDLEKVLQKKYHLCKLGFLVNDLHRHWLAYYSIKWLVRWFSSSHLVKNDAPLSVARGFRKTEWEALLKSLGFKSHSVKWVWAFRHLIVVEKESANHDS